MRKQYVRKALPVTAEEIDFENVHDVAAWCKGTVEYKLTRMMGTQTKLPVIMVPGQGKDRGKVFEAPLGCFIVELKGSFRVYKHASFHAAFDELVEYVAPDVPNGTPVPPEPEMFHEVDPKLGLPQPGQIFRGCNDGISFDN